MGNHGSALIFPDLSHKLRHKMFFSSLSLFHLRESAVVFSYLICGKRGKFHPCAEAAG
jgi:hypothetical protein